MMRIDSMLLRTLIAWFDSSVQLSGSNTFIRLSSRTSAQFAVTSTFSGSAQREVGRLAGFLIVLLELFFLQDDGGILQAVQSVIIAGLADSVRGRGAADIPWTVLGCGAGWCCPKFRSSLCVSRLSPATFCRERTSCWPQTC
eukprot:TRINITY_DN43732_c0_g2_i4.p1 TRINITY_DN43732_c0_g2~~TRINITY_DN43732_c0_g2_i4.p1  ORF type:complete len:142 (-),score=4.45 TRINITY_DN43732_c0_g2_i4:434-859(-)